MAALGMLLKKLIKEIEGMIDRGDCDGIMEHYEALKKYRKLAESEKTTIIILKYHLIYTDTSGLYCNIYDDIDTANEGLTEVYEKYMERIDETTAPYVIYGTVAKVEVQCAIVG